MTTTVHRTMCPMQCHPTYCGMLVEVEDGKVRSIRGDTDNPDSHGFLCIRGRSTVEIFDNPRRLLAPRVRAQRIDDAWQDTRWDSALDQIAAAMREYGPTATAVWGGHGVFVNGTGGQFLTRFAHLAGTQWWNPSIVCWGLGGLGFSLTGVTEVNAMDDMAAHADLIILWGANLASQPNSAPRIVAARKRGAHVVAIDIRRTEAFEQADESHLIRPGTDAALALAMIHVLISENLTDPAYIAAHTVGYDDLAAAVQDKTPEWAEAETSIPAETIRALARRYAATKRSLILTGAASMHKSGNSWHAARAIACLPALTGSLGVAGAGLGPRHAAQSHGMGTGRIVPPRATSTPYGDPVSPGTEIISEMSTILEALEADRIKVLLLLGTNMLSSFADSARVARALERVPLVVCFDLFMNETSRGYADIVLPGAAWLEDTGYKATNTHLYLMDQAVPPAGEAKPLWWLLARLSERLGVEGFFPWESVEGAVDTILDHPALRHSTVTSLREAGGFVPLDVSPVAHPTHQFATPSGKVEFVSQRAVALGLPALPVYERPTENGIGSPVAVRYPLVFTQGRAINHFHGFYDHGQALPTLARTEPEPRCWINPGDATARAVADGDLIRLHNDRGELEARALVTDRVPSGVVWMHDGQVGVNRLTSGARAVTDAAARDFPAGQASYESRVEVTRLA